MIRLKGCNMSLDRKEQGSDVDFISHAHSDHVAAARRSRCVLSSAETRDLINTAYRMRISWERSEAFELLDSGHMLGAKQLYIGDIGDGRSLVYSGDFQMQRAYACPPIRTRHADIAIVDSTYPHREVEFEDHEAVKEDMQAWVSKALGSGIVLFTAFRMGKAQELIGILNEAGIRPVVSKRIGEINGIYRESGIALDCASAYDGDADAAMRHNFVGISEARDVGALAARLEVVHGRKVHTAIATGLIKEFGFSAEGQFPLSSHADFQQTVEYLDRVRPETVLTYGRDRELMARNLTSAGIGAEPFHDIGSVDVLNIPVLNK
jgi:putative mRNA 3-end processing factor